MMQKRVVDLQELAINVTRSGGRIDFKDTREGCMA